VSDVGRPSIVMSDDGERIDGGEQRWSRINGGDSSFGNSSGEIQEIWDSNSLLLNSWWNMLDSNLDKISKHINPKNNSKRDEFFYI